MPDQPLWTPSEKRKSGSNLRRFMDELESSDGVGLQSYADILGFSTEKPEVFWLKLWEFCGVVAETRGKPVLIDGDKMPGGRFFPDARLNYAENMLRRNDDGPALVFRGEDKVKISHDLAPAQCARGPNPPCPCQERASSRATGFAPWCPIIPKPSWPFWPRPRWAPSGRPARRISASAAFSIASARLRPSFCSPAMAITMPARPHSLAREDRRGSDPTAKRRAHRGDRLHGPGRSHGRAVAQGENP